MIDPADRQTKPLPLDEQPAKPRRGRPATGQALSNAERQRLYRERQKAQRNEKSDKHAVPYEEVVAIAQELAERCKTAEKRVGQLEKLLTQRNEKASKGLSYRKLTEAAFDQLKIIEKSADTKTARNWSFGAYLLWQRVVLTMNVQRATREADEEKMRAIIGLDPRGPK